MAQDPAAYFEMRVRGIEAKQAKGINPYPHKFHVTSSLPKFVELYGALEAGQQLPDVSVSMAGETRHRDLIYRFAFQ